MWSLFHEACVLLELEDDIVLFWQLYLLILLLIDILLLGVFFCPGVMAHIAAGHGFGTQTLGLFGLWNDLSVLGEVYAVFANAAELGHLGIFNKLVGSDDLFFFVLILKQLYDEQ